MHHQIASVIPFVKKVLLVNLCCSERSFVAGRYRLCGDLSRQKANPLIALENLRGADGGVVKGTVPHDSSLSLDLTRARYATYIFLSVILRSEGPSFMHARLAL